MSALTLYENSPEKGHAALLDRQVFIFLQPSSQIELFKEISSMARKSQPNPGYCAFGRCRSTDGRAVTVEEYDTAHRDRPGGNLCPGHGSAVASGPDFGPLRWSNAAFHSDVHCPDINSRRYTVGIISSGFPFSGLAFGLPGAIAWTGALVYGASRYGRRCLVSPCGSNRAPLAGVRITLVLRSVGRRSKPDGHLKPVRAGTGNPH